MLALQEVMKALIGPPLLTFHVLKMSLRRIKLARSVDKPYHQRISPCNRLTEVPQDNTLNQSDMKMSNSQTTSWTGTAKPTLNTTAASKLTCRNITPNSNRRWCQFSKRSKNMNSSWSVWEIRSKTLDETKIANRLNCWQACTKNRNNYADTNPNWTTSFRK